MPSSLTFDEHLAVLETASRRLAELVALAGREAPVPTCPKWNAQALLAHQAMVHRWATAIVQGRDPIIDRDQVTLRTATDLPAYYLEGHAGLVAALRGAPRDLDVMIFLKDAPPPREFWARRQAHETTVHMVDALAASLGRLPTAADVDIEPALAVDGIDELLRGFFTRGRCRLYDGRDETLVVVATDVARRWVVHVGERLTVEPGEGMVGNRGDLAISGTSANLYLALWNRGGDVDASGGGDLLERWAASQRVRWR